MKFSILFLALFLAIPCYAVEVQEKETSSTVEVTITFTKDEFDLFILDKADPKEWIRNACQINTNRQEEFIKRDLVNQLIVPAPLTVKNEISKRKIERNKNIERQGSGVIYR